MTEEHPLDTAVQTEAERLFALQKDHAGELKQTNVRERRAMLRALKSALMEWRPKFHDALASDFNKPAAEVDLVEIMPVLGEIRYAHRHVRQWMAVHHVAAPPEFIGTRSYYRHEPKGNALIISPWNYPVNLSLVPLVSALAAGCTAIIKPSEHTPHTSETLRAMLAANFEERHVAVAPGDASMAKALLLQPFQHVFFTGSAGTGRHVMEAAARHHASVTLELGGKNPVVVLANANLHRTVRSILQTKLKNAGQTCLAPDFVLVHRSRHDTLVRALQEVIWETYPTSQHFEDDYCGIIHDRHLARMSSLVADATAKGARIVTGGEALPGRKFAPTLLTNVTTDMVILKEEIFGPILPVMPFDHVEDAIAIINSLDRALGMSVFGRGKAVRQVIDATHSGGVCINHCALNYYIPGLPYGGISRSGIGKAHGFYGFQEFSNARAVFVQRWSRATTDWMRPPYTRFKQRLIDLTLRWF